MFFRRLESDFKVIKKKKKKKEKERKIWVKIYISKNLNKKKQIEGLNFKFYDVIAI